MISQSVETVETPLEHRCRIIEMFALELANFESIEEMGPEVIRAIGRRIIGMVGDIRRSEIPEIIETNCPLCYDEGIVNGDYCECESGIQAEIAAESRD